MWELALAYTDGERYADAKNVLQEAVMFQTETLCVEDDPGLLEL